jgi:hypothetical protein
VAGTSGRYTKAVPGGHGKACGVLMAMLLGHSRAPNPLSGSQWLRTAEPAPRGTPGGCAKKSRLLSFGTACTGPRASGATSAWAGRSRT